MKSDLWSTQHHLAVLSDFDRRYPKAEVDEWPASDKSALQSRVGLSFTTLFRDLNELDARIALLERCESLRIRIIPGHVVPTDWRHRVGKAEKSAAMLQERLDKLLTLADLPAEPADLTGPRVFAITFAELWDSLYRDAPAPAPNQRCTPHVSR